jgi:hypothetical protein
MSAEQLTREAQAHELLAKGTDNPGEAREHLIKAHGLRMQVAKDQADAGGDYFHLRGEADRHRMAMEALIRQRPADFRGELPVLRRVAA